MSPTNEKRPATNGALSKTDLTDTEITSHHRGSGDWSPAHGVALRHRAALRLPPLESGSWDPQLEREPYTERQDRALCNELFRQGFDPEYLAHRFGVTPLKAVAA